MSKSKFERMNLIPNLKIALIGIALVATSSAFAQQKKAKPEKNKFLEGKKYSANFYEIKAAGRGKAQPTQMFIKSGKVEADLMYEKIAAPPMVYTVTLDSTYTEDETEMHMVTFEALYSEEGNDFKWEATVINYDIEGIVTLTKKGVEKKRYEFTGTEKAKK